jgi:oligoribonuclease (3'-5' exoribonuclease)
MVSQAQYIFLDAEFGGLEKEKYSLLTVYLTAVDADFKVIEDLYLYLKPDDGIYKVCASAMTVNKINLIEHDKIAITYKEAGTKLYNFLKKMSNDGKVKLIPSGHGVYGDVQWIVHHLISFGSWETFVSYRLLDTQATCRFLLACGLFPDTVSGSLVSIGQFLNVEVDINSAHDAKYDTELTLRVFLGLRDFLKKRYNQVSDKNFGFCIGDVPIQSSK